MTGKISEIFEKKIEFFFFTFFNASGYFGVPGNFFGGQEGAKPPGRLKTNARTRGRMASMFWHVSILKSPTVINS